MSWPLTNGDKETLPPVASERAYKLCVFTWKWLCMKWSYRSVQSLSRLLSKSAIYKAGCAHRPVLGRSTNGSFSLLKLFQRLRRGPVGERACCTSTGTWIQSPELRWKAGTVACEPVMVALWGSDRRMLRLPASSRFSVGPWQHKTQDFLLRPLCSPRGHTPVHTQHTYITLRHTHIHSISFNILPQL